MAAPLGLAAGQKTIADDVLPTAVTSTGASGTVKGVTALDAVEDALVPAEFVAVTVNV